MDQKFSENYLTVTEAARLIPGRPSAHSIWRWCRKGIISRSGCRLFLEHVRIGGKIYTTEKWLHEFCSELAHLDREHFKPKRKKRGSSRCKASSGLARAYQIKNAHKKLAEAGI